MAGSCQGARLVQIGRGPQQAGAVTRGQCAPLQGGHSVVGEVQHCGTGEAAVAEQQAAALRLGACRTPPSAAAAAFADPARLAGQPHVLQRHACAGMFRV